MRSRSPTIEEQALDIVGRYISPILARSVVARALSKAGVHGQSRAQGDNTRLAAILEDAAKLFVEPARCQELRVALQALSDPGATSSISDIGEHKFPIRVERDISIARTSARELAEQLGAPRYVSQRIATVVSELARNIVNYTPGGVIDIVPDVGPRDRAIIVRATDEGHGIKNLDEILAGNYTSKTGLGAGIRGAKRLADTFEIQTNDGGTKIKAVFRL